MVDNVIAVMESRHPHFTAQMSSCVEISRAQHPAELVPDNAVALREHLETTTRERVGTLDGVGVDVDRPAVRPTQGILDRLLEREETTKAMSDTAVESLKQE